MDVNKHFNKSPELPPGAVRERLEEIREYARAAVRAHGPHFEYGEPADPFDIRTEKQRRFYIRDKVIVEILDHILGITPLNIHIPEEDARRLRGQPV